MWQKEGKLMKKIQIGLVEGRHDLPIKDNVFLAGEITFPLNPDDLLATAAKKLDTFDLRIGDSITLYVTGLTAAAFAVIKYANQHGLHLTAMHFDRDSGTYIADYVL